MLRKFIYVAIALTIFASGLTGGYFMAGNERLAVVGEAQAGNCVSVTFQSANEQWNVSGGKCGYLIRFNKKPTSAEVGAANSVSITF